MALFGQAAEDQQTFFTRTRWAQALSTAPQWALLARARADLSSNKTTVGSENRGWKLNLKHREASTFELLVDDRAGTFENKYPVGGTVEVYVDTNNPPTTKVFRGKIEYWPKSALGTTKMLKIHATDYFFERILNVTATETYTNVKIGAILKDLIQKYLPSGFSSDLTGIQDSDVTVESITFRDEKLKSIFDRLAKLAGNWEYYCNPLLKVFFYSKNSRSTGLTVTDADIDPVPSQVRELYSMRTERARVFG